MKTILLPIVLAGLLLGGCTTPSQESRLAKNPTRHVHRTALEIDRTAQCVTPQTATEKHALRVMKDAGLTTDCAEARFALEMIRIEALRNQKLRQYRNRVYGLVEHGKLTYFEAETLYQQEAARVQDQRD